MEATVFNKEDLASTCLSTPTHCISDNSETDTINIEEISIDSNEQVSGDEHYEQMEEEDGEFDIIDETFYCAQTLQFIFQQMRNQTSRIISGNIGVSLTHQNLLYQYNVNVMIKLYQASGIPSGRNGIPQIPLHQ